MIVRQMTEEDVPKVWAIEKAVFPCPWSLKSFYDEVASPERALYHVVENDMGEIIAYGGMWKILEEGHITNIAVDKPFQGKGIGKLLVKEMLKEAKKREIERVTLEVRESNCVAQNLYKQFGFEVLGKRKNYYSNNNEDALIMWTDTLNEEGTNEDEDF